MSDIGKLLERMCPECGGELLDGIFHSKTEIVLDALLCRRCQWVYDKPKEGVEGAE